MNDGKLDIIITANSPGEVAAWLTPSLKALNEILPQAEFTVFIPPCPFASGREEAIVAALPGVRRIFDRKQLLLFILAGRNLPDFTPGSKGAVLFLGGDLIYAVLLARRLGYPAFAYTEGRVQWQNHFSGFFLPHEQAKNQAVKAGGESEKLHVVGNLMLDAVNLKWPRKSFLNTLRLDEHQPLIGLFAGSRPYEIKHILPMLLGSAEIIARDLKTVQFAVGLSPFVTEEQLTESLESASDILGGVGGELKDITPDNVLGRIWNLKTWSGLELSCVQGWQYDLMAAARLAITIPGSNTAEMAALGLPMVVITPLNKPELIPLQGIPGLVGSLPLIGKQLKRKAVLAYAERIQFTSQPNRWAQKEIVPELRGELRPEDVAVAVGDLMRKPEKLESMSRHLKQIMGKPGATRTMALIIKTALEQHPV
ncbi:MAG: hypothetical protein GX316_06710 [Firmicutes bacterium]|nr:hypothetical protein [Bacillota bacterium]